MARSQGWAYNIMTTTGDETCDNQVPLWAKRYSRALQRRENKKPWIHAPKARSNRNKSHCLNEWRTREKARYDTEDRINRVFEWVKGRSSPIAYTSVAKAEILRREFARLVGQWRTETRFSSSATEKVLHPAYQSIIAMGKLAVPLVLEELESKRGHWSWALHFMTGANPVPSGANIDEARAAWLEWGRAKGLLN